MSACSTSVVAAALAFTTVLAAGAASSPVVTAQPATPSAAARQPPSDALAWALGTNLGLAAAVQEQGTAPAIVKDKLATSERLAQALGTMTRSDARSWSHHCGYALQ